MKEKITLLGQFIVHERRKCGAGVAEFYVGVLALGDNYSEDIGAKLYDATFLIEYREKGVFTGRLNEIASQLKEDDNPVIMTISYKK
ncbi:MAG: hypothetical protein E7099_00860 [Mediterranea massiliensis]|nr:hypothetical protein [Mediterranea massiliensis]